MPKLLINNKEQWPDVLENISVTKVPFLYISNIKIIFKNGTSWNVDFPKKRSALSATMIDNLKELLQEYKSSAHTIELKVNISKIKKDSKTIFGALYI